MKTLNLVQGSPDWHHHRASHFNASDAPAMLGISPYQSRTDLLDRMKTRIAPEVDAATQQRFDDGHKFEEMARPWAENIIEDDFFPVTGAADIDGLPLSASFDGLTMDGSVGFEHKSLNQSIAAIARDGFVEQKDIPEYIRAQMEQQLIVANADKILFMASKGVEEEAVHGWYKSDGPLRQRILSGWAQFKKDLDDHQPKAVEVKPQGIAPDMLPSIHIELTGMVTASNLSEVRERSIQVFRAINRDLKTDDDFANAVKTVKWCADIEGRLDQAKENALSQTASISELFNTIDQIKGEARETRLALDKQIKAQKENRKREIIRERQEALRQHIESIQKTIIITMPTINADFAGSIKGKSSFSMMEDALDTELAAAKIEANRVADHLRGSVALVKEQADGYGFLFADLDQIAHKEHDDLENLIKLRISEHQQAEQKKNQEAIEPGPDQKPEPKPAKSSSIPPATPKTRPTDAEIIDVISLHYRVHESKVIEWLLDMDLSTESGKLVANL